MNRQDQMATLLDDWQMFKSVHCSKSCFTNAVDIEIEKERVKELSKKLSCALTINDLDDAELILAIDEFEQHLQKLKDMITIELLRNGN